ncbi:MAG: DUF2490 domain-containing protein [Cyclobacteriaceae bacterium]|nr:DUF2490 domain-containing protein [Cyclobacteriaceae bacterium]
MKKVTNLHTVTSRSASIGAVVILLLLNSLLLPAFGQKEVVRTDQQWIQYFTQVQLDTHWLMLADAGYRVQDGFTKRSLYILRMGAGYRINETHRLIMGFVHTGSYGNEGLKLMEYRPYQEWGIAQRLGKIGLKHRFRIEERFFKTVATEELPSEASFNFRFRYSAMVSIPLVTLSARYPERKLLLDVGEEIFVNAGQDIVYNVFDQNRVLLGTTVRFCKRLALSITYNHQFRALNQANTYRLDRVFWLGLRNNISMVR